MILINGRGMNLRDYVLLREREGMGQDVFGRSCEGDLAAPLERNLLSLAYFFPSDEDIDFPEENMVFITVPPIPGGPRLLSEGDQPYGWKGQINEYVAELAVSWAFDLTGQAEADIFLIKNRPVVIFQYYIEGHCEDLVVKFNGAYWEICAGGTR